MLKNKIRFSSTLDKELNDRLKEYSRLSGVPVSRIIAFALKEYLDKVTTKK